MQLHYVPFLLFIFLSTTILQFDNYACFFSFSSQMVPVTKIIYIVCVSTRIGRKRYGLAKDDRLAKWNRGG